MSAEDELPEDPATPADEAVMPPADAPLEPPADEAVMPVADVAPEADLPHGARPDASPPAEGEVSALSGSTQDEELPELRAALEAVLLVVDQPVAEVVLAQVVERPTEEVLATLQVLAEEYDAAGRGFELRQVSGGWRLYTRASCAPYVERFVRDGQQARLTQAALETLAVVAYRQPVSRARVSAIRGVNVDGVMRTLVTRGLVEENGVESESGAILYRTTDYFLERLGLRSLDDLPALAPHLPDLDALEAEDVSTST